MEEVNEVPKKTYDNLLCNSKSSLYEIPKNNIMLVKNNRVSRIEIMGSARNSADKERFSTNAKEMPPQTSNPCKKGSTKRFLIYVKKTMNKPITVSRISVIIGMLVTETTKPLTKKPNMRTVTSV